MASDHVTDEKCEGVIYGLYKGGVIVYIGQSCTYYNFKLRLQSHKRSKDFDDYKFEMHPISNLNDVEAEYILKSRPKYNKSVPSNDQLTCISKMQDEAMQAFKEFAIGSGYFFSLGDSKNAFQQITKEDARKVLDDFKVRLKINTKNPT